MQRDRFNATSKAVILISGFMTLSCAVGAAELGASFKPLALCKSLPVASESSMLHGADGRSSSMDVQIAQAPAADDKVAKVNGSDANSANESTSSRSNESSAAASSASNAKSTGGASDSSPAGTQANETTNTSSTSEKASGSESNSNSQSPFKSDWSKSFGKERWSNDAAKSETVEAPAEKAPPPGYADAVRLYSTGKWSLAAKEFEKFIKDGYSDDKTHGYLAYCLYNEHQYTQAIKEFDWVAQNATHSLTLRRSAEKSARTLRCYLTGTCPGNCLKANDPRWQHMHVAGHPDTELWIKFPGRNGGSQSFSQEHIGEVIEYVNGEPVNKGKCPICGGKGIVVPIKDGQPLPR